MARTTGAVKHVHQYYRNRKTGIWHCSGYDGCTHYMPKNMPEPMGQMSICWGCEEPFQLTPANMIIDKPTCDECAEQFENIEKFMEMRGLNKTSAQMAMERMDAIQKRTMDAHKEAKEKLKEKLKDEIEVIEPDAE